MSKTTFICDGRRYNTSKMVQISNDRVETGTGVGYDAIWMTPRSHRVFVDGYTCWQGESDSWWEADKEQVAEFAKEYPELLDLVPEGDY